MENDNILQERQRIKKIIDYKKEGIEIICSRTRRGKHIDKTDVLEMFDEVIFLIDNPDYKRKNI